jgi:hypothetical protein
MGINKQAGLTLVGIDPYEDVKHKARRLLVSDIFFYFAKAPNCTKSPISDIIPKISSKHLKALDQAMSRSSSKQLHSHIKQRQDIV